MSPPTTSAISITQVLYREARERAEVVLEVRPSKSHPDQGSIKVRTMTLNQNDEAVQIVVANLVVPRRST